jgi:hypothetical protein
MGHEYQRRLSKRKKCFAISLALRRQKNLRKFKPDDWLVVTQLIRTSWGSNHERIHAERVIGWTDEPYVEGDSESNSG